MKIFVLDNYDSFTYNLVQYLGELGADPIVRRNDEVTISGVAGINPDAVLISPGPGIPRNAGISLELVAWAIPRLPLLGVCLGHQVIGEALGGRVVRAQRLMHGKTSRIHHSGRGIFDGLPAPFEAMRYHSLLLDEHTLAPELEITAWTEDGGSRRELMGLALQDRPVFGVQFHPESIGTPEGKRILENFLTYVA